MESDVDLMEIQVRTLFIHNDRGRMTFTNEPEPDRRRAPRLFLGRTNTHNVWRIRDDVPARVAAELARLASTEPAPEDLGSKPMNRAAYVEALRSHGEIRKQYTGPAYGFPDEIRPPAGTVAITRSGARLLEGGFAWLRSTLVARQPCMAILRDGVVVSACWCSRIGREADEAGVETLPDYRGRGYGTAVVSAWAAAVREQGRIPLYSASWDNTASRRLAERLGLVMYGADFHIT